MAFFFKKKQQDELPPLESLPPLPPLPGEEDNNYPQQQMPMQQSYPDLPPMPSLPPLPPLPPRGLGERQQAVASDKATVFVRVDKYREIMQTIEGMQRKVDELQSTLDKIASIKEKEAEIIHGWGAMLQEAKAKVDEVNGKLQRPSEA